jgi:hypothetical protein
MRRGREKELLCRAEELARPDQLSFLIKREPL